VNSLTSLYFTNTPGVSTRLQSALFSCVLGYPIVLYSIELNCRVIEAAASIEINNAALITTFNAGSSSSAHDVLSGLNASDFDPGVGYDNTISIAGNPNSKPIVWRSGGITVPARNPLNMVVDVFAGFTATSVLECWVNIEWKQGKW